METQKSLADKLFPIVKEQEEVELKNIPPEQRRLHTETADLTVSSLHQYVTSGKIEIPEFQRGYPTPSSLASTPFTARAQPFNFRSRVVALMAGLKRCSSRQLSANFAGSG